MAKKYLDRYETEDELVKAYQELEKKLGEQGATQGELRKANQQYQHALQQYQQAVQQMAPVVNWYTQNYGQLRELLQNPQVRQTANQIAQQTVPGYELLTPQEKQSLLNEGIAAFNQQVFAPAMQQFAAQLQQLNAQQAMQLRGEMAQLQQAHTKVLWDGMRQIAPPDKLQTLDQQHALTMQFADPRIYNPAEYAKQFQSMTTRLAELEAKEAEFTKQRDAIERGGVSAITGAAPSIFDEAPPEKAASREDRLAATLTTFKNEVGPEAYREFMPTR